MEVSFPITPAWRWVSRSKSRADPDKQTNNIMLLTLLYPIGTNPIVKRAVSNPKTAQSDCAEETRKNAQLVWKRQHGSCPLSTGCSSRGILVVEGLCNSSFP